MSRATWSAIVGDFAVARDACKRFLNAVKTAQDYSTTNARGGSLSADTVRSNLASAKEYLEQARVALYQAEQRFENEK